MSLLAVPKRPRVRLNRPLWRQSLRDGLYNSLIDAWNCNEAAGNMAIRALGNHLSSTNTVGTAAGVSGHTGTARSFTRASSMELRLANAKLGRISPGTHDFTVSVWVYPTDVTGSGTFAGVWDPGINQREWILLWNVTGTRVNFDLSSAGSAATILVSGNFGAMSDDTWYHVLADYRASDGRMRLKVDNGTFDSDTHSGGIFQGSADFVVGARDASGTPGLFHDGRMGPLCMWHRLLTDQEQTLLYNGGLGWGYPF